MVRVPFGFVPRPYQIPLLKAIDSGTKRAICIWHRRSGKDKTLINLMVKKAYERKGTYAYILPTYVMSRNIIWRGMDKEGFRFIDHIPEELIKHKRDQEMEVELDNGSVIKLMGAEDPDRLRGINPVGVVFSEYAFMKQNVWDIIRPILTENGGWAIFNTTPNGKNHVYDMFNSARESKDWFCEVLTIAMTNVVTQEQVEAERENGMSEEMIQQEFYCSFEIGAVGSLWGSELAAIRQKGQIGFYPKEDHLPYEFIFDLGRTDATAVWIRQYDNGKERFPAHYEVSGTTLEQDKMNLDQMGYPNPKTVVLPHDARHKRKEAIHSMEEQAKVLWPNAEIIILPASSPMERVKMVRQYLKYVFFHENGCAEGLRRLENYKKRYNRVKQAYEEVPLHDENSHSSDAFGYTAYYWMMSKPKVEQDLVADAYDVFAQHQNQFETIYDDLSPI